MANKLYVGNLPYTVDDAQLNDLFAPIGDIVSAVVITDRHSGRSKGFGFVEFKDEAAAKKAVDEFKEKEVDGRTLVVNEARPRQPRDFQGGDQR